MMNILSVGCYVAFPLSIEILIQIIRSRGFRVLLKTSFPFWTYMEISAVRVIHTESEDRLKVICIFVCANLGFWLWAPRLMNVNRANVELHICSQYPSILISRRSNFNARELGLQYNQVLKPRKGGGGTSNMFQAFYIQSPVLTVIIWQRTTK